jgi:ribose transport system permease protein
MKRNLDYNSLLKLKSYKYFIILLSLSLLIILIIIFQFGNQNFLKPFNITTLLDLISILLIVGLGQMSVILTGGIDLTIGPNISLSTILFVILLQRLGYIGFIIPIIAASAIGIINGLIVTKIRIPSFIATIGMNGIVLSLALLLSKGGQIPIATGFYNHIELINGSIFVFKNLWIITIILVVIFYLIFNRTVIGRNIYIIGSSEKVALFSGINVNLSKIIAFMFSGFAAGIVGVVLGSRSFGGHASLGNPYILESIAVVTIGGVALSGGVGGILNVLMGAILIAVIKNGMTVIGIDVIYQQIILGTMIILAVALTIDRSKVAVIK